MKTRIVVLGAGTGGTLTANRLRASDRGDQLHITVVDQDTRHVYQPGLLFVPFGLATADDIVRPRAKQLHHGIDFVQSPIDHVDVAAKTVTLVNAETLPYDVLVVATGATLAPDETEGLADGWGGNVHSFYTLESAEKLAIALRGFEGGKLVLNVVDMPIKCPVAPLEFCFLADWFFQDRKIRDHVELTFVTPLDGAFTKPVASEHFASMLADRNINLVSEFNTGEVDRFDGKLVSYDDREVPFDLAVVIPLHSGQDYVGRSDGLGDDLNFVPTNPNTLQSLADPAIFAIGDATALPVSKAGSVSHFEGDIMVENILRYIAGRELDASYDGHANCFIETGFGKAMLIDFNYEQEPVPGHFPGRVGLPLMKESRMNHLGKLMFQWFYWHVLLPGRDVPGITATMPTAGKQIPATPITEE
jgi:sulfide:quinone oxidoreductase